MPLLRKKKNPKKVSEQSEVRKMAIKAKKQEIQKSRKSRNDCLKAKYLAIIAFEHHSIITTITTTTTR